MNYWDILLAEKLKKDPPLPPIPDNAYLLEEATGDVITLTDAAALPMPSATSTLAPIQDLHGYSSPWVGGAGKNLFGFEEWLKSKNVTYTKQGNAYTLTANYLVGSSNYWEFSDTPINVTLSATVENGTATNVGFRLKNTVNDEVSTKGTYITMVANAVYIDWSTSGTATITEPQIEVGTQATAYEPYSNICPISGYDSASLTILDNSTKKQYFEGLLNGTYGFVDLGGLTWTYDTTNNVFYCATIPNGAITNTNKICEKYQLYSGAIGDMPNGTFRVAGGVSGIYVKDTRYTDPTTFTIAMNGVYLIYELATPTTPTITSEQYETLATAFNGQAVMLEFENAIYGGVIDWISGVVTVNKKLVDMNTLTWNYQNTNAFFYTNTILDIKQVGVYGDSNIISSQYVWHGVGGSQLANGEMMCNSKILHVKDTRYTDATVFKNAMDGVQLVYELATPTTITLTPTQLRTLAGHNTIYTDVGNITLEYWRKEVRA